MHRLTYSDQSRIQEVVVGAHTIWHPVTCNKLIFWWPFSFVVIIAFDIFWRHFLLIVFTQLHPCSSSPLSRSSVFLNFSNQKSLPEKYKWRCAALEKFEAAEWCSDVLHLNLTTDHIILTYLYTHWQATCVQFCNSRLQTQTAIQKCTYFRSHDKDGSHTIWFAVAENSMLHANLMALSST